MAEVPITDQEISILCDVLEGWGAKMDLLARKTGNRFRGVGVVRDLFGNNALNP
jgi:hypothetical protein